jgi:hypothetical protein
MLPVVLSALLALFLLPPTDRRNHTSSWDQSQNHPKRGVVSGAVADQVTSIMQAERTNAAFIDLLPPIVSLLEHLLQPGQCAPKILVLSRQ